MTETPIVEPVGPCPITGYPLVAVHEVSGTHAGLALAALDDYERHRGAPTSPPSAPPLRLDEVATPSEVFRSWAELLIFATTERFMSDPEQVAIDYQRCLDVLHARHHYDTTRITASVHIAAVEYLRNQEPWATPEVVLVPDVGLEHIRSSAHAAVQRLLAPKAPFTSATDRLRHTYLQRLTAAG